MKFFWPKNQNISNVGKIRKYKEVRVFFFEEKTFSFFKTASLPSWEGAKYASGSRPLCLKLSIRAAFRHQRCLRFSPAQHKELCTYVFSSMFRQLFSRSFNIELLSYALYEKEPIAFLRVLEFVGARRSLALNRPVIKRT